MGQKMGFPVKIKALTTALYLLAACGSGGPSGPESGPLQPEHEGQYGIYSFDQVSGEINLIYSSDDQIRKINQDDTGNRIVFRQDFGDNQFIDSEICLINSDGSGYQRLTFNSWLDVYPCWSPDASRILFLSWPDYPDNTMDIFMMDPDGQNTVEFYDSGFHDGDCCWEGGKIVFTRESQIWIMNSDGTEVEQLTDYDLAGQQGSADLPFGDYDPRLNASATLVCFDRMVDDQVPSGNYNFYTILPDGTGETPITNTGYSQFMAEWSHAGNRLVFLLAAIDGVGLYDNYSMNPDGSDVVNITPAGWPPDFLCTYPIYSWDDSRILFVGQWWE
jgi:Tol biopolymer transport system component